MMKIEIKMTKMMTKKKGGQKQKNTQKQEEDTKKTNAKRLIKKATRKMKAKRMKEKEKEKKKTKSSMPSALYFLMVWIKHLETHETIICVLFFIEHKGKRFDSRHSFFAGQQCEQGLAQEISSQSSSKNQRTESPSSEQGLAAAAFLQSHDERPS
ncbi:hypothetical protein QOT17_020560 [Balamuthia mandrillaris]